MEQDGICVLSVVAAKGMETQNTSWKCLQTEQTGPCLCRQVPSLPHSLCAFSSTWVQSHSSHPCPALHRTCMSRYISWHHRWAETTKSPRMTWILHQIRKTTTMENQVLNYELGPKQQPLLLTIPINYSWFMSQSWAQLTELTYTFNVNVCWPDLPIPWSLLTAEERLSKWQLWLCPTCSSTRGRWEKRQREGWGTELGGWMLTVLCAGEQVSYPRDAALLLGAQWNAFQVIPPSKPFTRMSVAQGGCRVCGRTEQLLWFLTALQLCGKNGDCVQKALIKPKITPHFFCEKQVINIITVSSRSQI